MALEYQIDSLDGVDEAVKPLYKEVEGGKFVLEVAGVVPKSDYDTLNQKAVDATTEAARRRKTVERITGKLGLEDANGLDDALEALMAKPKSKENDADQQAIIEQIKSQAEAEKKALQSQLDGIRTDGAKAQFKSALMAQGFGEKVADMVASSNMNKVQFDDAGKCVLCRITETPLPVRGPMGSPHLATFQRNWQRPCPNSSRIRAKGEAVNPQRAEVEQVRRKRRHVPRLTPCRNLTAHHSFQTAAKSHSETANIGVTPNG